MLESPPPLPPPFPFPPPPPPPPPPLPTAPGLRHSRLYDITFLTPSAARSTAGTLLLGRGRFAATVETTEFELRGEGKFSLSCHGVGEGDSRELWGWGQRATGCRSEKGKVGGCAAFCVGLATPASGHLGV